LSATLPGPGPKAEKKRPTTTQYTPSSGPKPDKNRPMTRSTPPSPDPKKLKSPLAAGANEPLMHSGRNFDTLVRMASLTKVVFQQDLRKSHKHTQSYLDHAYDIVHGIRKCHVCVLQEIKPKKGDAVLDDEEKKVSEPDPSKKRIEMRSPNSNQKDSPSNETVIRFPPMPNEMAYIEDNCLEYVHVSGPLDISCDFEAVDKLILFEPYPFIFPIH
jgi:hypothetical protein